MNMISINWNEASSFVNDNNLIIGLVVVGIIGVVWYYMNSKKKTVDVNPFDVLENSIEPDGFKNKIERDKALLQKILAESIHETQSIIFKLTNLQTGITHLDSQIELQNKDAGLSSNIGSLKDLKSIRKNNWDEAIQLNNKYFSLRNRIVQVKRCLKKMGVQPQSNTEPVEVQKTKPTSKRPRLKLIYQLIKDGQGFEQLTELEIKMAVGMLKRLKSVSNHVREAIIKEANKRGIIPKEK